MKIEIEVVAVYRIKGDRKTFRTYAAVVNRLAWLMVFEKYGDTFSVCEYGATEVYPKREPIFSDKCDCHVKKYHPYGMNGVDTPAPGYEQCPVHDRNDGYLRILHDRVVRYILTNYPVAQYAVVENEN